MLNKPTILALCAAVVLTAHAPRLQAQAGTRLLDAPLQLPEFAEAYNRIKQDFVDEVDPAILSKHSIQDILKALDPHSRYLDAAQYSAFRAKNRGQFGGLGIRINEENGRFRVLAPAPATPAQLAGIRDGDWIFDVDGHPADHMKMSDLVSKLRGEPGTSVTLTLLRNGESTPLSLQLTRAELVAPSVDARLLEQRLGYVRISRFHARSHDELVEALRALQTQAGGKLSGLVLDLRNNPGGLLSSGIAVADAFLAEGRIVSTSGRNRSERIWNAKPDDLLSGAPMAVLVNERSASSAEIVAGALQDHKRAVIVGTQTFGKGSVQSIFPLESGGALKLTTARYYTPSGRSLQGSGITPDAVLTSQAAGTPVSATRPDGMNLEAHVSHLIGDPGTMAATSGGHGDDRGLGSAVRLLQELRAERPKAEHLWRDAGGV